MKQPNTQFLREAQFILWLQWIFLTALSSLVGWFWMINHRGAMTKFAVIAAVIAFAQWLIIRRYTKMSHLLWGIVWVGMTALGAAGGHTLGLKVTSYLPNLWTDFNFSNLIAGIILGGVLGVCFGFGIGLSQIVLLIGRMALPPVWLLANVVGWGLGFQFGSLFLHSGTMAFLITAITAASVNGLWVAQLISAE